MVNIILAYLQTTPIPSKQTDELNHDKTILLNDSCLLKTKSF